MQSGKRKHSSTKEIKSIRTIKNELHPKNKHRERYNFKQLVESCPDLAPYVELNKYNNETINFSDPEAVKLLNKALLKHFYGINYWNIPPNYMCPPIPGRADYIHHIAELLGNNNGGIIPTGSKIKCLDVGVGANCVYPIIGNKEYGWSFIGSDIDSLSVESANKIIQSNPELHDLVEIRFQTNANNIFEGIIKAGEHFDISICNPPFHSSQAEAESGNLRKLSNLNKKEITTSSLNFGGKSNELWCIGGEERFVNTMIYQSQQFKTSCTWFSTLISKKSNLESAYKTLKKVKAFEVKTIQMGQGNKISRIIAWTF